MPRLPFCTLLLSLFVPGLVGVAQAQDVCTQLWVERNSIYKSYGYCFKTARAIRYFGNAGCVYDREGDVPLSRVDQARIQAIRIQERRLGCG